VHTTGRQPLASLGLPVFNGERFVAEAIESLLAQEGVDFELVISDNGSTDGTEEICRAAAGRDPRVRYIRHDVNRGAAWNYNHVVDVSRGRYFKWCAHDDLYAPGFLARCVEVLDADDSVSACYTLATDIDEAGAPIHEYPPFPYADTDDPADRARAVLDNPTPCFESFALVRRAQLLRTGRIGAYTSSDRTLMFELALLGRFHEVPERLFFHRQHQGRSVFRFKDPRERNAWFDPSRADVFTLPRWRLVAEHAKAVRRADVTVGCRLRVGASVTRWTAQSAVPLARQLGAWAVHRAGSARRRVAGPADAPHPRPPVAEKSA
jgi:glycosyltransferase involved in cell wall biosynthesis